MMKHTICNKQTSKTFVESNVARKPIHRPDVELASHKSHDCVMVNRESLETTKLCLLKVINKQRQDEQHE